MTTHWSGRPARAALVGCLLGALWLAGCGGEAEFALPGGNGEEDESAGQWRAVDEAPPTPTPTPSPTPEGPDEEELIASWEEMADDLEGEAGMVVMPVGGDEEDAIVFGDTHAAPAWSTMKVPIGLAAYRKSPETTEKQIESSLVVSDNATAESLWGSLDGSAQARETVDDLLAEAGDTTTRVGRDEHGDSVSTGLTHWTLQDQAMFTAGLACLEDAEAVLEPMGRITDEHAWGLGELEDSMFKGGWGQAEGTFTSRQLGLVPVETGEEDDPATVAVAMLVLNGPGEGHSELDDLAHWLEDNLEYLPAGTCSD